MFPKFHEFFKTSLKLHPLFLRCWNFRPLVLITSKKILNMVGGPHSPTITTTPVPVSSRRCSSMFQPVPAERRVEVSCWWCRVATAVCLCLSRASHAPKVDGSRIPFVPPWMGIHMLVPEGCETKGTSYPGLCTRPKIRSGGWVWFFLYPAKSDVGYVGIKQYPPVNRTGSRVVGYGYFSFPNLRRNQ